MYAYQREAVDWMAIREEDRRTPGGFLCHEMGLGKTHMMCSLIKEKIRKVHRTLLLTTKSTIGSWHDTLTSYSKSEFEVSVGAVGVISPKRPTVVVATHHSVLKHTDWFVLQSFDRIIVDEAHIMRNRGRIFQRIREIATAAKYRWGVTATPFNNTDKDMLCYMQFLRPSEADVNPKAFKHYFIRKLRSDVMNDGPSLNITKMVYSFETEEEQKMYDYVSHRIDETNDWVQRNRSVVPWRMRGQIVLTMIMRKRQAAIHPQLVLNAEKVWAKQMGEVVPDWDSKKVTKLNKIMDLVSEDQRSKKNTMIITHFKGELEIIYDRLVAEGIRTFALDGSTPADDRRTLETINTDIPTVIVLQIQAGGVGISLPWVHHVINAAPDWNPFLEKQAIYRAYRANTPHDVNVTAMYFKNTIEIDMQTRQAEKMKRAAEWLNDPLESISAYVSMPT
jgi:SNF2 family DNA or RNA helicase